MGLTLHELYEVSRLIIGDAPYEEYIPTIEELHLLKKDNPQVHETYWEVLCYFHIWGQTTGWRNSGVKQMSWASYLFNDLIDKNVLVTCLTPSTDEEIVSVLLPVHTP